MSYAIWKRALDVTIAALLLLLTLPLWALVACLLLLTQGAPVLFRQRRMGMAGRPFTLLKFRTMRDGEPPRLPDRPVVKSPHDVRVTPVGGLLRRLSIDELPQLLNVLHGEMSMVGPRPLPVDDLERSDWLQQVSAEERARRLAWAHRRQEALPGLTGLWQITANDARDFENWVCCDLAYVEQRCLWLDLRILWQTPWAVLRGRADQRATRRGKSAAAPR